LSPKGLKRRGQKQKNLKIALGGENPRCKNETLWDARGGRGVEANAPTNKKNKRDRFPNDGSRAPVSFELQEVRSNQASGVLDEESGKGKNRTFPKGKKGKK